MPIEYFLGFVLSLSLLTNAYLLFKITRKPIRPQSVELREFLGDLLGGTGIVAVGRIDPNSILMRSPKQK